MAAFSINSGAPTTTARPGGATFMTSPTPFRCTIVPHGHSFALTERETILDAALAQGASVPFSCRRGACGSCRAQVIAGTHERISPSTETSYRVDPGELLMCQCRATSDLELAFSHWTLPPAPAARHAARVVSLEAQQSISVTRLVVELQTAQVFTCAPGQHMHLITRAGERRSFSIANLPAASPGASKLEFHIRKVPGGAFTDLELATLQPGDLLEIDGPHGTCTWREPPPRVGHLVLLATGTGLAGVSAILLTALACPTMAAITLYWGVRSMQDCYASGWLDDLQRQHPRFRWQPVLSGTSQAESASSRAPRRVQEAALADAHPWQESVVYACGHPGMVRDAREALLAAGLASFNFRSEAFVPQGAAPGESVPVAPRHPWEKVGARFTLEGILLARAQSKTALGEIAAQVVPGMTAGEAMALADTHLRSMGSTHNWHPTYVRFGPDTQRSAREAIDLHRTLGREDIFTIDLGPVWDGYEGDYGDTFFVGQRLVHDRCVRTARSIFGRVREAWLKGMRGTDLYAFAATLASRDGYALVREVAGHRVSDFPHALYGKQRLAEADFVPEEGIWVLEVQVRDLHSPVGAFFEDVLLSD